MSCATARGAATARQPYAASNMTGSSASGGTSSSRPSAAGPAQGVRKLHSPQLLYPVGGVVLRICARTNFVLKTRAAIKRNLPHDEDSAGFGEPRACFSA